MGTKHSLFCLQVDVRYHRDSFAMLKWKPELRHRSRRIEMCVYCQHQIILSCTSQNEMIQLLNRLPLMFSYMQFDTIKLSTTAYISSKVASLFTVFKSGTLCFFLCILPLLQAPTTHNWSCHAPDGKPLSIFLDKFSNLWKQPIYGEPCHCVITILGFL